MEYKYGLVKSHLQVLFVAANIYGEYPGFAAAILENGERAQKAVSKVDKTAEKNKALKEYDDERIKILKDADKKATDGGSASIIDLEVKEKIKALEKKMPKGASAFNKVWEAKVPFQPYHIYSDELPSHGGKGTSKFGAQLIRTLKALGILVMRDKL
jgi:hypothetical protein